MRLDLFDCDNNPVSDGDISADGADSLDNGLDDGPDGRVSVVKPIDWSTSYLCAHRVQQQPPPLSGIHATMAASPILCRVFGHALRAPCHSTEDRFSWLRFYRSYLTLLYRQPAPTMVLLRV